MNAFLTRRGPRFPYRLTRDGERYAPSCSKLLETAEDFIPRSLLLRRWTLPVIASLDGWSLRFSEIRAMLPDTTPRALSATLKHLIEVRVVEREVLVGFPPSAIYRLGESTESIVPMLRKISDVS